MIVIGDDLIILLLIERDVVADDVIIVVEGVSICSRIYSGKNKSSLLFIIMITFSCGVYKKFP